MVPKVGKFAASKSDKKSVSKSGEKKKNKADRIYDAAYDIITTKGVNNTVIDDIVKKAGVAKGTFYLYFKDKYDLVDKIILQKSTVLISDALKAVSEMEKVRTMDFREEVVFFIDYLVERFRNNKKLLAVIYKNLSWGFYKEALTNKEMRDAVERFTSKYKAKGGEERSAHQILYIILEMVGGVCYNSIALEEPYSFDEIREELYTSVIKILS